MTQLSVTSFAYFPVFFPFQLLENEIFKFEEQICDLEEDLAASERAQAEGREADVIPEEAKDALHAAIGKAKLLMAQKLAQFRGLCDKNIVSSPINRLFSNLKMRPTCRR